MRAILVPMVFAVGVTTLSQGSPPASAKGCLAARQVNLNKRTPAPGTRAGLPSDPSPSDRMTMCWTCSVDAFRRGFRPAARRTTHRRSCGLG